MRAIGNNGFQCYHCCFCYPTPFKWCFTKVCTYNNLISQPLWQNKLTSAYYLADRFMFSTMAKGKLTREAKGHVGNRASLHTLRLTSRPPTCVTLFSRWGSSTLDNFHHCIGQPYPNLPANLWEMGDCTVQLWWCMSAPWELPWVLYQQL